MNNKLMAQVFSDAISVAQRPTMAGECGRKHRGYIVINDEVIKAMLYAMRQLQCKNVEFGSYGCYEPTISGASVDGCLVGEINGLNNSDVETIGCCCGHGRRSGYIQVSPEHIPKMLDLGYEQRPIDENGNGEWCFKPKTVLP